MTLADIEPSGRCYVTSAAESHPEFQSRLYALGLYPGVWVDVLHVAPFGDPMQVRVGQTLISIRRREATLVEVKAAE